MPENGAKHVDMLDLMQGNDDFDSEPVLQIMRPYFFAFQQHVPAEPPAVCTDALVGLKVAICCQLSC